HQRVRKAQRIHGREGSAAVFAACRNFGILSHELRHLQNPAPTPPGRASGPARPRPGRAHRRQLPPEPLRGREFLCRSVAQRGRRGHPLHPRSVHVRQLTLIAHDLQVEAGEDEGLGAVAASLIEVGEGVAITGLKFIG
nr:hypothetical protein [Tanacetum cinerariifolium]